MVLNKKVNLKDLEVVDYELYKGLTWISYLIPLFVTGRTTYQARSK